jgi:hypothetical protein
MRLRTGPANAGPVSFAASDIESFAPLDFVVRFRHAGVTHGARARCHEALAR